MAIKLEMLRTFQIVAEHGTLAQAADRLGRTPSAISMMLSQLEDQLGAALFEADRKNRLTPLGLMVLEEGSRATEVFDRSVEAIRRHALSTAGTVRIAAVPSATVTLLPRAITAFRKARPQVRLEISDVDSAAVMRALQRDEADLGIVSAPVGGASAATEVMQDLLGIICHPDGPIARAARTPGGADCPRGWDLLRLEPLLANPLCRLVRDPIVDALADQAVLSARNTASLLAFVGAGLGATILPSSVMTADRSGLLFIRPDAPEMRRSLLVRDNPKRQLSPASRAFREMLFRGGE
jgi:DNA-binding transcriptional LysR family regulator